MMDSVLLLFLVSNLIEALFFLHHGRVHSPLILLPVEPTIYPSLHKDLKIYIKLQISSKGSSSLEYLEIFLCVLISFFLPHTSKKHHVAELLVNLEDKPCLKVCDTLAEQHSDNSMPVHFNKLVINKRVSPLMFPVLATTMERTGLMKISSCELCEESALFLLNSLQ